MVCGKGPGIGKYLKQAVNKKPGEMGPAGKNALESFMPSKAPKAPDTPIPMPTADDEAVQRARRRSLANQRQRSGRTSTVLTQRESLG